MATAKKSAAKKTAGEKPAAKKAAAKIAANVEAVSANTGHAYEPTHKEIAERAHHLWQQRGGHYGNHDQDWTDAERELRETKAKR